MNKLIKLFIFIVSFSFYASVNAQQGCCSWHGGVDYCGNNGYYICKDGTRSPSCTCSSQYYNFNENDSHKDNNENYKDNNVQYDKFGIPILQEPIVEKKENSNKGNILSAITFFLIFGFIGYSFVIGNKSTKN